MVAVASLVAVAAANVARSTAAVQHKAVTEKAAATGGKKSKKPRNGKGNRNPGAGSSAPKKRSGQSGNGTGKRSKVALTEAGGAADLDDGRYIGGDGRPI